MEKRPGPSCAPTVVALTTRARGNRQCVCCCRLVTEARRLCDDSHGVGWRKFCSSSESIRYQCEAFRGVASVVAPCGTEIGAPNTTLSVKVPQPPFHLLYAPISISDAMPARGTHQPYLGASMPHRRNVDAWPILRLWAVSPQPCPRARIRSSPLGACQAISALWPVAGVLSNMSLRACLLASMPLRDARIVHDTHSPTRMHEQFAIGAMCAVDRLRKLLVAVPSALHGRLETQRIIVFQE
jgi:hypothetical protein